MKLLEKYIGLSDQAENLDSYEAYKELIETIRELSYEELHGIMRDSETALEILVRGETTCKLAGIDMLVRDIVNLGELYLKQREMFSGEINRPQYTYEWIEKNQEKNNS